METIKKIRNYSYSVVTYPLVIKELIFYFLVITRGLFLWKTFLHKSLGKWTSERLYTIVNIYSKIYYKSVHYLI